ncbi:MAG TPA: S9 family peptidase, partial [Candidatus Aminicenantes bacterium]|nr:S9 family peptidase [Candidatus Aminicenantes bacterium]
MHPFNSPLKTWIIRAAALISVFGTVFGSTGATHPFSIHDMLAMERISDMQVSPDGTRILFSLRTTDLEANKGRTDVWLIGADGKNLRRLTSHPASDFNARWSSCGRCVFFLSTRSGSAQVWRIKIDGGEAEQVTHLPLDAGNLVVSQAGDLIAFTLDVFPGETPAATAKRLEEIHNAKATGRLYDRLFIRHWDTWSDGRRSHLFVMSKRGGEAKDLMPSMDADTPHKPFGGPEEIAFTPDGKGLVFTARDAGREEAWSTNHDLFYVPADGSKAPARLTGDNKAWDTTPVFSPDGKTLAYLAMARPDYEADRFRIVLRPWPGGKDRVLTESWDYSVGSMCWSADGTKILVSAAD